MQTCTFVLKILKTTLLNFFTFLWAVRLAPIRNDGLANFPPQSVRPLSLYSFSKRPYVFQFPNQHFTIIHLFESHNRSTLFSLGRRWFHREKGRQSPVQAQPFISVCFICTCSQATIVSPLKWHMLRFFNRHD
jgi:hypothetical protein